jgi:hypothetical protein
MLDKLKHIALRGLLYLSLAFGSLAFCGLLFWVSIRLGVDDLGPWIFLTGYTGVLLYAGIAPARQYWSRPAFWPVVIGFAALHFFGFVFVLRHYPAWRPVWYIPIVIFEAGVLGFIQDALFRDRSKGRRHHGHGTAAH